MFLYCTYIIDFYGYHGYYGVERPTMCPLVKLEVAVPDPNCFNKGTFIIVNNGKINY